MKNDMRHATRQPGSKAAINWEPIKMAIVSGQMTWPEASRAFEVKEDTIRKRANREAWPTPKRIAKAIQTKLSNPVQNSAVGEAVANIARERIERHIATAFDIASKSVAKFRAKAPKDFRELNVADQIARRAAGIQDTAPQTAVMLQLNEAVNCFDPDAQPVEDESIPRPTAGNYERSVIRDRPSPTP
jgi:hypothetical protein